MAGPVRLVGLDVARCLALLGMVATHMLRPVDAAGEETWPHLVAAGRAAALFAVLAGVTLALLSGRRTPLRGRSMGPAVVGLAARALLIALLGLALGELDTGLAIILTYYGLLFLLGLPFVVLRARALAVLAGAWVLAAPVVSHVVRPELPERRFDNPDFEQLTQPGLLLSELLFTGYYPVVPWLAYLLVGMAVGRSELTHRAVQVGMLAGGAVLAVAASVGSRLLTEGRFDPGVLDRARTDSYGTTPTGGRLDWLLVSAPHTGTPFDLAQTIGSALVVIGGCLLVVGVLPRPGVKVLAVVFGAGTMTLTLYSLHAWLRTDALVPPGPDAMATHVVVLGVIGAVFVLVGWRGPLEVAVGLPGRLLRNRVGRP